MNDAPKKMAAALAFLLLIGHGARAAGTENTPDDPAFAAILAKKPAVPLTKEDAGRILAEAPERPEERSEEAPDEAYREEFAVEETVVEEVQEETVAEEAQEEAAAEGSGEEDAGAAEEIIRAVAEALEA